MRKEKIRKVGKRDEEVEVGRGTLEKGRDKNC
jgi:hypothetical protein